MKKLNKIVFLLLAITGTFTLSDRANAQNIVGQNQYKSPADELLHIERISLSPVFDNAEGIYARPIERHLIERLGQNHRYNFIPASSDFPPTSAEAFVKDEKLAKSYGEKEKVDAFFATRITQFPTGLEISINLFLTKDGTSIIQGELRNLKGDSIAFLKGQVDILLAQIFEKLPYSGQVMSREGIKVTINLGEKDGIKKGSEVNVVQLLAVNRHPKLKFLINTEKEVIGKLKVLKAEPTLSFALIQMEKEKGIVTKGSKLNSLGEVKYSDIETGFDDGSGEIKKNYAFGEAPTEWRPLDAPTFGKVTGKFGLSRFQQNLNLQGVDSITGKNNFAPMVELEGELWLTSEWTVHGSLRQGLISVDNPREGSSPGELSQSLTAYEFLFGYRFRFGPTGPSSFAEPFIGYFSHQLFADASQPETFSTMKYSGLRAGLMGEFPVTEDQIWRAGGKVSFALFTNLRESPITSGSSSDNGTVQFQFYGSKALSARLRALGSVDFEQFSTNFSGAGTRAESADSGSVRYMTFSGGMSYTF